MHTHAQSFSYIIRCLHIPKEPLQPQHDLDWHRDVINTIKPKQSKAKQRAKQKAKQSKAKTAILIFIIIFSLTQIKSYHIKDMLLDSDNNLLYDSDSIRFDSI